jgi:hypothetical protein
LEAFKTPCLRELFLLFPIDESKRLSTTKLNRVLLRSKEDAIQFRTLANTVESEGELIQEQISKKAEEILERHGFSAEGKPFESNEGWRPGFEPSTITEESNSKGIEDRNLEKEIQSTERKTFDSNKEDSSEKAPGTIAEELIHKAIEDLNAGKEKELQIDASELHETFEDPESIKANISLDDVLSKKQKESNREKDAPSKGQKEFVKNTVAHLQQGEHTPYILNAPCVEKMMILVLAFLLNNGLFSGAGQLVFFIDGAADLRSAIQSLFFVLLPFKIILDWYHLEEKCKKRLSSAMKGKKIRTKVLEHITPLLWHGKIDTAIAYLEGLNADDVRNQEEIKRLIGKFLAQ